jgi:hypothetical protein
MKTVEDEDVSAECGTTPFKFDIHKSYEFLYQVGLTDFGNFGTIKMPDGFRLRELLAISIDTTG